MIKIKLDPDFKVSNENPVLLISRLINGINQTYPMLRSGLKEYLFNSLKKYSLDSDRYDYEILLSVLCKLYPGEFQKELMKND